MGTDLDLDQGRLLHADRRVGLPATGTSARSGRQTALLDAFLQAATRRAAVAGSATPLAARPAGARPLPLLALAAAQRLRQHRPGRTQLHKLRLLRPDPPPQRLLRPTQPRVLLPQPDERGLPATRLRQSLAQSHVRRSRRHRPRRLRRALQSDLQALLHRLGPLQRIPQPPNVVRQRHNPVVLVAKPPRPIVEPDGLVQQPAQRGLVVALLAQNLVQPANLGRLDLRRRRRLAQPGNLPAQRRLAVPARLDAGIRKQLAETGYLRLQRQRVLRRAARFLRLLDRRQPLAPRRLELPLPIARFATCGHLRPLQRFRPRFRRLGTIERLLIQPPPARPPGQRSPFGNRSGFRVPTRHGRDHSEYRSALPVQNTGVAERLLANGLDGPADSGLESGNGRGNQIRRVGIKPIL